MTGSERDRFIKQYFEFTCRPLLVNKGREYAVEGDANGNFKRIAAETGTSILVTWNTFFQKHLDSIRGYVNNPDIEMTEIIELRIADAVNYLLILASMVEERRVIKWKDQQQSPYGGGDGGE